MYCNITILNLTCSVFHMDMLLRIIIRTYSIQECLELKKYGEHSDLIYYLNFYVKLENSYLVLRQKYSNGYFS